MKYMSMYRVAIVESMQLRRAAGIGDSQRVIKLVRAYSTMAEGRR